MNQSTTVAIIVVASFAGGFFVGRVSAPQAPAAAPMAVNAAPTPFPGAAPAAPMAPMARGPMMNAPMMGNAPVGNAPQGEPESAPVGGKIQEIIQVPNFTYLRLDTGHGEEWAAVPTNDKLSNGQQVSISHPLKMTGFTSKTLNRTFDSIWFGELGQ
ncbi:MAG: hypothetical protein QM723_20070 [Myxococcaceae bacterium]